MPRPYKLRSTKDRLDALLVQIQKLEVAQQRREQKIGRLRTVATNLFALTKNLETITPTPEEAKP